MKYEIEGRGTITCNKDTMNVISMLAEEASKMYALKGRPSLAQQARDIANGIYDMLDKKGYYDSIR